MRNLHRCLTLFLLLITFGNLLLLPSMASTVETDGLEITIEMDKEEYDVGEPITATITVVNLNEIPVTVTNIEQLIPEGYFLAPESEAALKDVTLEPEEYVTLTVTLVANEMLDEDVEPDFFTILLEGETWGISNLLLVGLAIVAFVIFMLLT